LEQQKGSLKPGADADLVFLDTSDRVRLTMVAGQIVYQNMH
jgi:N-acetylglucosamine-6-phosphate deacetylase